MAPQTNSATSASFRAIIVGAGVTGLTAAHAFEKAGIDYTVVEAWSEAAPPVGASITVFPHTLRVLKQLGIADQVDRLSVPFTDGATNRYPNGKTLDNSDLWGFFKENHGHDVLLLERRALLEVLYDTLPDKSKVLFNKKLTKTVESASGIEVFFHDGTSEKADIVVGADGVHSGVREAMWDRANSIEPGIITVEEKKAIMTTWTCLFGYGPGFPSQRNELSVIPLEDHRCILVATQPSRSFFFVFWKADKPWSRYTRPRYTAEDAEKAAATVADAPINENMVFGELWKKRYRAQLADIEEGVLSRWHYGRHVLLGDAAHKVTPNMALGGNLGMESVFVLTNYLRKALATNEFKPFETTNELSRIFEQFQIQQMPRAKQIFEFSSFVSRVHAWDSLWIKLSSIYIAPRSDPRAVPNALAEIIRRAPVLDFLPLDNEWPKGTVAWENAEEDTKRAAIAIKEKLNGSPRASVTESGSKSTLARSARLLVGGIFAVSGVVWATVHR